MLAGRSVHARPRLLIPQRLWDLLARSDALRDGNPGRGDISQMHHGWNCAWNAHRAGATAELVAIALFHDVGKVVDEVYHGAVVANLMRGFVSPAALAIVRHHGDFQAAPDFIAREWAHADWFETACAFAQWDASAFASTTSADQRRLIRARIC